MKQTFSKAFIMASVAVFILAGCKSTIEEQAAPSPINTIKELPSAAPHKEATAVPASTPAPQADVLLPYYEIKNNEKDLENQERSKLWGYMDRMGKAVIQPAFSSADLFNKKGIAIVRGTGTSKFYGLINQTGAYVLDAKYTEIKTNGGFFAALTDDNHSLLIDEEGHVIKSGIAGEIGSFYEGKASLRVGELYGFIDLTGEIVVKPQFNYVYDYKDGKAVVRIKEGLFALLNGKGEQVHTYNTQFVKSFSEGLAAAKLTENSKLGYINEEGELIIADKFENAEPFHEGLAAVSLKNYESQTGLINNKGGYVLQPQYGEIVYMGKSLWAISKITRQMRYDNAAEPVKYALYNAKGEKLTDDVFDEVQPFQGDYAVVHQGVSSFLIDATGHKTKDWPVIEGIGDLKMMNNLLIANVDNELKYVTAQGEIIWQDVYIYDLGNGAVIKEAKYRSNAHFLSYYPVIEGLKNEDAQKKLNQIFKQESIANPVFEEGGQNDFDQSFSVVVRLKDLLVIKFSSYNYTGGAHGMPGESYYHLNLQTGKSYTLKDLFKPESNFLSKIDQILKKLIKIQGEDKGVFKDSILGFDGITEQQLFYIENKTLHIVFSPYEIGPYAAGFITFDIPLQEMDNIVNKTGSFWQSFH